MKINTSYKAHTHAECGDKHSVSEGEYRRACMDTVRIYRHATDFFIDVVNRYWDVISELPGIIQRVPMVEKLTVVTKTRPVVPEPFGEGECYKMPAYLRRAAISEAIGRVSSYRSNLANWEKAPKGKKTGLGKSGYVYPTLYKDNCYRRIDAYTLLIKLYVHNTWDWVCVRLRKSDADYMARHCADRIPKSPTLRRRGREWYLDFAFEENIKLQNTNIFAKTILSVDLGLNSPAVCTAMSADGTILGRHFLKLPKEQDSLRHALNMIKKAQQHGARKMPRLWAGAKGVNEDIAQKTASFIMDVSSMYDTDVIVFEFLDFSKRKRGSKKQRLHHWKAQAVQRIVTDKAHRKGIRISRVCAWGTSKLAYDGSGRVTRGIDSTHSICRFRSGKIYNCDLSAAYNIGARYYIRELLKSLPVTARSALEAKVPRVAARSTCTWSDYINLLAGLREISLFTDGKWTTAPAIA